jgi:hypothetical protein
MVKKDVYIKFRCNSEEKELWKKEAQKLGLSLSEFIRIQLAEVCIIPKSMIGTLIQPQIKPKRELPQIPGAKIHKKKPLITDEKMEFIVKNASLISDFKIEVNMKVKDQKFEKHDHIVPTNLDEIARKKEFEIYLKGLDEKAREQLSKKLEEEKLAKEVGLK